jgi:hypothetical protein
MQPRSLVLPRDDVRLSQKQPMCLDHCLDCGFVFLAFDSDPGELYSEDYWPSSNTPADHIRELSEELARRAHANGDDFILEIGSNDGHMLALFRDRGFSHTLGVEPSRECCDRANLRGVPTRRAFFNREEARRLHEEAGQPKILICRHVIEHIPNPAAFIEDLAGLMEGDTLLLLECPSFEMTAGKGDISTIWEEHTNYFTLGTLGRLLDRAGLGVEEHRYVEHGGGSLLLFVRKCAESADWPDARPFATAFERLSRANIANAQRLFSRLADEQHGLAAWGAGSRGLCLLALAGIADHFDFLVDDSAGRQGLCVPGSQLVVGSFIELQERMPAHCVVLPLRSKSVEAGLMARAVGYQDRGGRFIELFPGSPWNSPLLINSDQTPPAPNERQRFRQGSASGDEAVAYWAREPHQ